MRNHSASGTTRSNIIPIPDPAKLLDPIFLEAHCLIDRTPRDRLIALIPLLSREANQGAGDMRVSDPVDKKILPPTARTERSTAGPVVSVGRAKRSELS